MALLSCSVVLLGLIRRSWPAGEKCGMAYRGGRNMRITALYCMKLAEALDQQYARPTDAVRYCFGALNIYSSNIVALRASQAWGFILDSYLWYVLRYNRSHL